MTLSPLDPRLRGSNSPLPDPVECAQRPEPFRKPYARALLMAVGLAGALAAPAAAAPATVTVANKQFGPSAVSIVAGESVTWNFTEASHDVAGAGWLGNTGYGTGSFTRVFPAAGTFSYVCEAHSNMKGTVTVAAAAVTAPVPGAPVVVVAPGIPAGGDVLAPSLGSPRVWLPLSMTRPRLNVRLSEDALVGIATRRVGANKDMPSIVRHGAKGANHFVLKLRGLRPGHYRVRITAKDPAGNSARVRQTTLRIPGRR